MCKGNTHGDSKRIYLSYLCRIQRLIYSAYQAKLEAMLNILSIDVYVRRCATKVSLRPREFGIFKGNMLEHNRMEYLPNLVRIQRLICVGSTGALRSATQKGLEAIYDIRPPIYVQDRSCAANVALRLGELDMFKRNTCGHSCIPNTMDAHVMIEEVSDYIVP